MKIKSIRRISKDKYPKVYDLSVKGVERFFIRDPKGSTYVLVHNSSMYPSSVIAFNIGPNTYVMQIQNPNRALLLKKIYKELTEEHEQILDQKITVVANPMIWYTGDSLGQEIETTYREVFSIIDERGYILAPTGSIFKHHSQELSFLGEIFVEFRELRDEFRAQLKAAKQENKDKLLIGLLDRYQLAVKLLMNSGYGAIGNESFVFYNTYVAESITQFGQQTIKTVVANLDRLLQNIEAILIQEVKESK